MLPEIVGVAGLVIIFVLAMWRGINMGLVALAAAFLVGTFYFHQEAEDIAAQFPTKLLVILIGVTFFFGLAKLNGTVDHVVHAAIRATRGHAWAISWVFFLLSALIVGSGAQSTAVVAILIPLGQAFAQRYRISPLLMGLAVLNGTNAGGFSPVAVYFNIVNTVLSKQHIDVDPTGVFIWTFIANAVIQAVAFLVLGGPGLIRRERAERNSHARVLAASGAAGSAGSAAAGAAVTGAIPEAPAASGTADPSLAPATPWGAKNTITVVLFAAILGLGLFARLDVGFLAIVAAVVLLLIYPGDAKAAVARIEWNVILLIGGIVTYVGVLQEAGVVDTIAGGVAGIGAPLLAALVLMYIAGVVSAFASTNALFGVLAPLAAPLLLAGGLPVTGFTIAMCVAASAVDSSPFSTGGALVVANTEESKKDETFRGMMIWGMACVVVVPVAVWLAFIVP